MQLLVLTKHSLAFELAFFTPVLYIGLSRRGLAQQQGLPPARSDILPPGTELEKAKLETRPEKKYETA